MVHWSLHFWVKSKFPEEDTVAVGGQGRMELVQAQIFVGNEVGGGKDCVRRSQKVSPPRGTDAVTTESWDACDGPYLVKRVFPLSLKGAGAIQDAWCLMGWATGWAVEWEEEEMESGEETGNLTADC